MRIDELPADVAPPAHLWMPEYEETSGWEAIDFAASIGYDLDGAQRLALQMMFAEKKVEGRWEPAAFEWALVCTRQQLKTYLLEAANLADIFVFGHQVMWTAHRVRTTQLTILRFLQLIEEHPDLDRRVLQVSRENGNEWIRTRGNGLIEFMARTNIGGRGFSGNKLTLDEAFALTPLEVGSLFPILTARAEAQVRYASSAGMAESTILRTIRDRGRRGGDQALAYLEFADVEPPSCRLGDACTHQLGTIGCCVDDPARWLRASPGVFAGRTTLGKIASFRNSAMPVAEFTREFMGWWDEPTGEAVITPADWADLTDPDSQIVTRPWFALDVSPNRSWAAIAAAGFDAEQRAHVEVTGRVVGDERVLDYRPGTMWVLDRLEQLHDAWPRMRLQIARGSAAESLVVGIERAGIPVDVVPDHDVASACALLYDYAAARTLVHVGQPVLDKSIENTRWRDIGDKNRIFARRKSAGDISPSYAAALALRAADAARHGDYDLMSSVF